MRPDVTINLTAGGFRQACGGKWLGGDDKVWGQKQLFWNWRKRGLGIFCVWIQLRVQTENQAWFVDFDMGEWNGERRSVFGVFLLYDQCHREWKQSSDYKGLGQFPKIKNSWGEDFTKIDRSRVEIKTDWVESRFLEQLNQVKDSKIRRMNDEISDSDCLELFNKVKVIFER